MSPSPVGVEKTVFEPFRHRFRPFIGERDSGKMPWHLAFRAFALRKAD